MARHPGTVLREDFMKPLNLSAARLAVLAGLSEQTVYQILACKRRVTPETAVRLGKVFRMRPQHWLSWQTEWDLASLEVPSDVQRADLTGFVTGPRGVRPLPVTVPTKEPDTYFSSPLKEAVVEAAELVQNARLQATKHRKKN